MQEYVKDCILTNEFRDLVLLRVVELTMYSIHTNRPLFANPLEEPEFYRKHFFLWVREALDEKKLLDQAEKVDPFSEE